jgi:hypothetical protein
MRWAWTLLLVGAQAWAQPLVRLDHIPTAVRDLEAAMTDFRALGFALKPGRPHANSLRNAHIKFANGAGLELITAAEARDALSGRYMDFLRQGEGPAYLTLHADDEIHAAAALNAAGIPHRLDADGLALTDPRLDWIFFAGDNRSPTDQPEHFGHANGAFATREVWVATDDPAPLVQLLRALGANSREETRREPLAAPAHVFGLADGGRVVIVAARHQLVPGHPLMGVVMASSASAAPVQTHGLWLTLQSEH